MPPFPTTFVGCNSPCSVSSDLLKLPPHLLDQCWPHVTFYACIGMLMVTLTMPNPHLEHFFASHRSIDVAYCNTYLYLFGY